MINRYLKIIFSIILSNLLLVNLANTEILKKIEINGNLRISDQTIEMFSNISIRNLSPTVSTV